MNIFEFKMNKLEDVFRIEGFDRNALVIFRNASKMTSHNDLTNSIIEYDSDIDLSSYIRSNVATDRMYIIELFKDPKTTIDIISIYTRLLDNDTNYEGKLNDGLLTEYLKDKDYKTLYIEMTYDFDYKWIEELIEKFNIEMVI